MLPGTVGNDGVHGRGDVGRKDVRILQRLRWFGRGDSSLTGVHSSCELRDFGEV